MSDVRSARARVAINTRHHGAEAPQTQNAQRDLAAARIVAAIQKNVAAAPPLTPEQRDRLHRMLNGVS